MKQNDVFFRPPWTCGKHNAEKHVAIMFNLLSNSEYFFEEDSADVVGVVLRAGRNGIVSVNEISEELNIAPDSIAPFFISLLECGLLTSSIPSEEFIREYRKQCAAIPNVTSYFGNNVSDYSQSDANPVETTYVNAVKDCTMINSVMFELTFRCSEKCLHCYNPGAIRNDKEKSSRGEIVELSIDDYRRIIDELCDAGLVTASITGGDPFSNKDVWDILDYLYQKDIAVSIFTNGLALNNYIDRIASYYPRDVRISLYSADAEEHDYITQVKGSWQKSVDVISSLRKLSIPIIINCVVMRPCIKSFLDLKAFGKKHNCTVVFDVGVTDSIDGDICATQNLRLTTKELEIVLMDSDVAERTDENELYTTPTPTNSTPCLAGVGNYCITPDGILIPCVAFRMELGDLKKQSFLSIVRNNHLLNKWYNTKPSDYEECWTHDYCSYCNFCVGNNYREHGNIRKASENNCYIAKARHKIALSLGMGVAMSKETEIRSRIDSLPKYDYCVLHRQLKKG